MAATTPAPDVTGTVFDEVEAELARTYAEALLGAAEKSNAADATLDELDELIADVWEGQPEFAALLVSPALATPEKGRILAEVFEGRARPLVSHFLQVLNRHGRLGLLKAVAREARALWDRRQRRRHVIVRSAVPLDEAQLAAVRAKVAPLVNGTPILHTKVDPSLIGGLVIQVDDYVYDASVRHRFLEQFRRRLIEQKTHEVLAQGDAFRSS